MVETVHPQKWVLQEAARLDALLARGLQRHQATPQELADDGTFVRRAYLGIVGRIPNLQETERFLADQSPDKRATLCDRLLDSPGRTSHFANFWFDLLRVKSNQRQLNGEPFAHFIREAIQKDLPYDRFVSDMLTAQGPAHEKGKGATGYLMRDTNMPHDAMANTLRLFLGTRLECAQCHNHPFDHWTQKEFYEMAAFFGGIQYRDPSGAQKYAGLRNTLANEDQRVRARALQMVRQLTQGITGAGSGKEQLPKDYKYDDLKPGASVLANTIFGADVKLKYASTKSSDRRRRQRRGEDEPGADSRLALAEWMTSSKNPMFAKVIANRMWARTFGRGLVEPSDDWREDTKAVHPELMDALEKLMVKVDFDLRQFERVLVHTQLFQREAEPTDPQPGIAPLFTGPVLRRMTAEQMWDSLLTLVFDDIDDRLRPLDDRAAPVYQQFDELKNADPQELLAMIKSGRDPRREMAQEARRAAREQMQRDGALAKRAQPLLKELQAARRDGDLKRVAELAGRLEQMGFRLGERAGRGQEGDMLRASDLSQPARPGHLLRQFGQSDRETIDASSDAATVPQVLTLLNGFLDDRVLKGQSALARDLSTAEDGVRRVRIAFLTTLNREPTEDEIDTWRRQIAVNGIEVVRDLVWVLCNSNEFRFVR
ncbi:MAG: DUF1549 domain-containing protein [Planctomycetes bacterium]|nr:DUF1549 domain-containing protein [Planctomycetota bacterium]